MNISRRGLIGLAGVSAISTACHKLKTVTSGKRLQGKYNLRLVMAIPKTLPIWGPFVEDFANKVSIISEGEVNISVYGAGELVPALGVFEAVKLGQVDMGHAAAYYWQGKIPASSFFTCVPFGMNANGMRSWIQYGGGQQLWNELYGEHNLIAFPAGNTGLQMGGWYRKRIETISDLKGLKMRIPGLGGKVMAKAGAKPMLVAGGEIYTNLATGVLDATEWVGPYHDYLMGFHKVAPFYYYPGWHEPGPLLEMMINKKKWESFPPYVKTLIETAIGDLDRNIYSAWLHKDAEYFKKIQNDKNVQVLRFSDDVLTHLKELSEQVVGEVMESSDIANRVGKSFKDFKTLYKNHQYVSEHTYSKFINLKETEI